MKWKSTFSSWEFRAGASSGLLLALSAPPLPLGFLGYVALVPILVLFFQPEAIRARWQPDLRILALSFGFARYAVQLHWLVLLGDASPLSFRWALPFMLLLLVLYLTLADWIFFWLLRKLRTAAGAQAIWWFPGLWILFEWSRALGDMGFPWLRLASTQLHYVPMIQIAGLLGELGVSLFVLWINVLIALAWQGWRAGFPGLGRAVLSRWWAPTSLLLLMGFNMMYGFATIRQLDASDAKLDTLEVGVIQANVDLNDKWDSSKRDSTFVPYTNLTRGVARQGARLVIWPETAIPLDILRNPVYLERVRQIVRSNEIHLIAGFPEHTVRDDGRLESYNSSFQMDEAGVIRDRYRKMHLLAFGESMPFQHLVPLLGKWDLGQAEWSRGPEQTVFEVDGFRCVVLICFESIFSNQARSAVMGGAGFLVNITNDGWFGDTILPYQHASLAVMRAAENRVPLVRCANNGLSFWVDAAGRVHQQTSLFHRESFTTLLRPRPGGSIYTRYGDIPLFLLIAAGFAFLLLVRRVASAPD